jgi:hypothetical protein
MARGHQQTNASIPADTPAKNNPLPHLPKLDHTNVVMTTKQLPKSQTMIQHRGNPKMVPLSHLPKGGLLKNRNKVRRPPPETLYRITEAGMFILVDREPLTAHHKKLLLSVKPQSKL